MKGRCCGSEERWSLLHPKSLEECKDPLFFPDISVSSLPKTLQTPLHTFLLRKRGFPPPRSRRSCWCPPGLCTLVWTGLPPASTGGIHRLTTRYIFITTQSFNTVTLDWGMHDCHVCETIRTSRSWNIMTVEHLQNRISTEVLRILKHSI